MKQTAKYRIPILYIQDTLVKIPVHPYVVYMKTMLDKCVQNNATNWGIKDAGYIIKYELEKQWYPVFIFDNRWLADAFLREVIELSYIQKKLGEKTNAKFKKYG